MSAGSAVTSQEEEGAWPRDTARLPDVEQLITWTERLAAVVTDSRLANLAVSVGDVRWEFTAPAPAAAPLAPVAPVAVAATPAGVAAGLAAAQPATPETPPGLPVTAPLVGVFYCAPGPGQPPFVSVGDRIEAGRQVGIVEAMKMMNEVVTPQAGTVREVHVPDGEVVEYGQVLVTIEPA